MPLTDLLIRPAHTGEAALLTGICLRAKAHWGYDSIFMEAAAQLLQIREGEIGAGRVLTALRDEKPCGVAAIVPLRRAGWFELSHLFVGPEYLRQGIGGALFQAAVELAARTGAHLSILSDPNAAGFYERLGARRCGAAQSDVERGRMLPLFEFAIGERPPEQRGPS